MKIKIFVIICFLPLFSCSGRKCSDVPIISIGAEQLSQYLPLIKGKRIGVVANDVSRINGKHLVDTLLRLNLDKALNYEIVSIFSPEHGFSLNFEAGKTVENEQYDRESVTMISLYGKKKKPLKQDLENIDVVIFDLQDVGVRFYTYISTLHYVMEACAENSISLIVLDRPNPHCAYIDGPILEEKYKSFVGMHKVPIVYGMTIGEYAQMINGEGWLANNVKCELHVIEISGYKRGMSFNFPMKPSPNLPNMNSINLYPSLCLFEGTVVSIGRGTEFPFQVYGHPDYSDAKFSFIPVSKPGASTQPKHKNTTCYGVNLQNLSYDSFGSGINLNYLIDAYKNLDMGSEFFIDYFDLLAGTSKLKMDIMEGKAVKEIKQSWKLELETFRKIRNKYLLYE